MSEALFACALVYLIYAYVLFPALLFVRSRVLPRDVKSADICPRVTMIIPAYNEESVIADKLENTLSLNYPHDKLDVLVASDGSIDATDAIVRQYADRGVRLLSLPRGGKNATLNTAMAAATGEILVFGDANNIYARDALRALVRPFADPRVGGVAGDQHYLDEDHGDASADGERVYWNLDRKLKQWQSRAGSITSATGAIYAIRRSLAREVPPGAADDFVLSANVIARRRRLVFAPDAVAYERVTGSGGAEFRRKVRVITVGLRAVACMSELLNPFRHGFYALQLLSQKVLRRLVVVPLLVLLVVSPLMWIDALVYQLATLAQVGLYGLAAAAALLGESRYGRRKIFVLPYFFCLVNLAALVGTVKTMTGRASDRWEPQQRVPIADASAHASADSITVGAPSARAS